MSPLFVFSVGAFAAKHRTPMRESHRKTLSDSVRAAYQTARHDCAGTLAIWQFALRAAVTDSQARTRWQHDEGAACCSLTGSRRFFGQSQHRLHRVSRIEHRTSHMSLGRPEGPGEENLFLGNLWRARGL